MAFYVADENGTEMANGRRFGSQADAEAAARKSLRLRIAAAIKAGRGYVASLDVVEEIPGRHTIRARVTA